MERGDTIDTLARWNGRAGSGESHAAPGSAPCTAQLQAAAGGFVAWQGEVANVAVRGDKALFRGLWKLLGSASVAWILLGCALIGHLSRTHGAC